MKAFKGSKAKVVQRFGVNIFESPKYDRILENRPNPPGVHGANKRRKKNSDYGLQLMEKQKLKFSYGLTEKQFRNLYQKAEKMKGPTGENLVVLLERRLDNVVFRLGLGMTRAQARQFISHCHLEINKKKVNIASYRVKEGDIITIRAKSGSKKLAERYLEENKWREVPSWLKMDSGKLEGQIIRVPERKEINCHANEQMIVELYSK